MGRIIALANQKGGVGKTTTAINLSASLAAAEVPVLLVDCDPQSNSTTGLGFVKDPDRVSTYHLLMGLADAREAMQKIDPEGLFVIPAHKNLVGANLELAQQSFDDETLNQDQANDPGKDLGQSLDEPSRTTPKAGREYRLRQALERIRQDFAFIILDCPPALDLLTLNALVAADSVLIPMQPEYFALEGISELLDTMERVRQSFNPGLAVEGVVLTMFDDRTNLAQQVAGELKKFFGDRLLQTCIPRNIRLAEAPSHGKPVLMYDVHSRGAESYIRLAKEIMSRLPGRQPDEKRKEQTLAEQQSAVEAEDRV